MPIDPWLSHLLLECALCYSFKEIKADLPTPKSEKTGGGKSELENRKLEIGSRKSEVGRPSSAFVCYRFCCMKQKYTRLKVKQCRLNVQRFDFVLLTNTVHRNKNYERWFLSLFLFLDTGCKCMGTSVCWSIHMFEYSANDFTTSSRSFCFSSKRFSVFRRNDHKRRTVETRC